MSVTKNIANYVSDIGVNLAELARKSGIEYSAVYASLADKNKERELRANELISICSVLKINPMEFADEPEGRGESRK